MLPNPWAFASVSLAWTKNWLKIFNATFPQLLCAHGMSPVRWDECLRNGIYISHAVLPASYTYLTDTELMTRQVLVQLGFRRRLDTRWDLSPSFTLSCSPSLDPSPFLFLPLSLLSLLIWPHSQGGAAVVSHHHLSDTPPLSGMLLPSTPEWDPVCFVGSEGVLMPEPRTSPERLSVLTNWAGSQYPYWFFLGVGQLHWATHMESHSSSKFMGSRGEERTHEGTEKWRGPVSCPQHKDNHFRPIMLTQVC